jgi:HlyD family type I secretion membrane fusion protein
MSLSVTNEPKLDLQEAPTAPGDVDWMIRFGYAVVAVCFGGFLLWTGFARIDSAVIAGGSVAYETRRKVVQHLEGGIVQDLLVREGQAVEEGQVLFRLEDTQARANLELVQNSLDGLLAQEARLLAERDQASEIEFPAELLARAGQPVVAKIIQDQVTQFRERRGSIEGQIGILEGRVNQYQSEIEGLRLERVSSDRQLAFIDDELTGVRDLADKGLVPKTRWLALEREAARLQGVVGRNEAEVAKAQNSAAEMRMQIQQIKQKMREEVSASLQDTRQKMNDARERRRVAEDVLRRLEVTAPRSGKAQGVKVTTRGQVIRPGEALAEVVPIADDLIIEAQVGVTDIDKMREGAMAEVRFTNFHTRTTPVILGKINTVSRDRLYDETTRQSYFLAQISISDTDIPNELKEALSAGMQVEVIIPTGERTVLRYLVQPLTDAMAKTFRER